MKYACPHCEGHIEAGEEFSGLKIHCPHCSGIIDVPRIPPRLPGDPAILHAAEHGGPTVLYRHHLINDRLLRALQPQTEWRSSQRW